MEGLVLKVMAEKNFGFIKGTDGQEYFFHRQTYNGFWSDLVEDLMKGKDVRVEFQPVDNPKGPRAHDVERLDYPNQSGSTGSEIEDV